MTSAIAKAPIIVLSDQFAQLVVHGPGIDVEFKDGEIHVRSGSVKTPGLAASMPVTSSCAALAIGEVVGEGPNKGLVYAGLATDGRYLLVDREDAKDANGKRLWMSFGEAAKHAKAEGMEVPSKQDLELLRRHAEAIGGFDRSRDRWYWSASEYTYFNAWIQRFSDGCQANIYKNFGFHVRCVRRCSVI